MPQNIIKELHEATEKWMELDKKTTVKRYLLLTALEHIPVGCSIIDKGGNIIMFNDRAKEVIGLPQVGDYHTWSEDYGIFTADGSRVQPEDLPGIKALQGEEAEGILRFRNEYVDNLVWITCNPVYDENGELVAVISYFDIESGEVNA